MTVICLVRVPHPLEDLERAESENPDVFGAIVAAGARYIVGHRRGAADAEVIEINEFPDRESYEAFLEAAGPSIQRLNEILGGEPAVDRLYTSVPDPEP